MGLWGEAASRAAAQTWARDGRSRLGLRGVLAVLAKWAAGFVVTLLVLNAAFGKEGEADSAATLRGLVAGAVGLGLVYGLEVLSQASRIHRSALDRESALRQRMAAQERPSVAQLATVGAEVRALASDINNAKDGDPRLVNGRPSKETDLALIELGNAWETWCHRELLGLTRGGELAMMFSARIQPPVMVHGRSSALGALDYFLEQRITRLHQINAIQATQQRPPSEP
jgi:hypothetical protein